MTRNRKKKHIANKQNQNSEAQFQVMAIPVPRAKVLKAKTPNQQLLMDSIDNNSITFIEGPAGSGKALTLDSTLWSETGPITMGDIKINDKIYDNNGVLSRVAGVYPQGLKDCYRVNFNDGSYVDCSEDHKWEVYSKDYIYLRKKTVVDTKFLIRNIKKNLEISLTKAVQFPKRDVSVDPYILGLLIGDGSLTQNVEITSIDEEIVNSMSEYCILQNLTLVKLKKISYRVRGNPDNTLLTRIKALGLFGKRSEGKFLPKEYIYNSVDIRLDILNGLLDTDGTVDKAGKNITYCTVSKQLSEDVKLLIESLGGICITTSRYPKFRHKGEMKTGQLAYNLNIRLEHYKDKLFRLSRKRNRVKENKKYLNISRQIDYIEYIGKKDCQCISVDNESHLFLTNNFIATHNTHICMGMAVQYLREHAIDKIILTRPIMQVDEDLGFLPGTADDKLLPYLLPLYDELKYYSTKVESDKWKLDKTIEVVPLALMRGRNFHNSFIILDEAQNCTGKQMQMALTRIGNGSIMVVNGDSAQTDLPQRKAGALNYFMSALYGVDDIGIVRFENGDVIRNGIITSILDRLAIYGKTNPMTM